MTMFQELKSVLDTATTEIQLLPPVENSVERGKKAFGFKEETFFGAVLFRWDDWKTEVKQLSSVQGISCYPPLWTTESSVSFSTKILPIEEIFKLELEVSKQIYMNGE